MTNTIIIVAKQYMHVTAVRSLVPATGGLDDFHEVERVIELVPNDVFRVRSIDGNLVEVRRGEFAELPENSFAVLKIGRR